MTADLTRLLDELQARCDAATEGPWSAADEHAYIGESPSWCVSQMRPGFESMSDVDGYIGDIADLADLQADAEFIAAARQDLPRLIAAARAVLDLHRPVEVEPSGTICGECSFRLPNGRYFGKIAEFPCPTVTAITTALEAS